ncbi:MAG TPA: hypothetical protein VEV16_01290 [Daejeonella sp.]|nr:hypothetical protein [Daejeonella sp.]
MSSARNKIEHRRIYHRDRGSSDFSQDQTNIASVGHIAFEEDEGHGSFKKITERVNRKLYPNEKGLGENEERHSSNIWGRISKFFKQVLDYL